MKFFDVLFKRLITLKTGFYEKGIKYIEGITLLNKNHFMIFPRGFTDEDTEKIFVTTTRIFSTVLKTNFDYIKRHFACFKNLQSCFIRNYKTVEYLRVRIFHNIPKIYKSKTLARKNIEPVIFKN